ncbi:vegetative cell wall protein gp1 [Zea mays]|uniref:vegetative cell wall protein gp1 n=1 Tax=Zea mays TaxID=4577 RepID=UPI0004DEBA57|nr:vegetative cell wall protein gp1-like [Zea mays]XP_023155829.1 vegetative cell wall protein gp1-like [Zea mays]|eukprot:XP_023155828.1 vegetative cell wall protein gp1-like [Zea mays]
MASSTSSPWKPAPSPCSLPSRAPPAAMAELLFSPAVPLRAGSTKASAPFLPWRAWSRPLRPAPLRPLAPVLGVLLPPPADLHLPAPWLPSSRKLSPLPAPFFSLCPPLQTASPLLAVLRGARRLFVKMCSKPHAAGSLFCEARWTARRDARRAFAVFGADPLAMSSTLATVKVALRAWPFDEMPSLVDSPCD